MEAVCDVKIILLGESDVGKTSLILRFIDDPFKGSLAKTSIKKYEKIIKIEGTVVKLSLWDTGGREAYYNLVKSYFTIADGVLFIYDVQKASTFSALSKWLNDFKSVNEKAEALIVGNKAEDDDNSSVNGAEVKTFVRTKKVDCTEVSAKNGKNVNYLFHHLLHKILVAKGSLPYSKDSHLTELEKCEAFISSASVVSEQQKPIDVNSKTDALTEVDSLINCPKLTDQSLKTVDYTSNARINVPLKENEVYEIEEDDDLSSGDYGSFVFYSIEDLPRSSDEDSVESAKEFSKRLDKADHFSIHDIGGFKGEKSGTRSKVPKKI